MEIFDADVGEPVPRELVVTLEGSLEKKNDKIVNVVVEGCVKKGCCM